MDGARQIKVRSSVSPSLKRSLLLRGTLLAGVGGVLLLAGGTLFPLEVLRIWGIPIFALSFTLIALGLIPYRKLARLEDTPHELHYDGDFLTFYERGRLRFKIPLASIESITYVEQERLYGICFKLKRPLPEQIKVLDARFDIASFMAKSMQHHGGCDLFFPYFSKRGYEDLKSLLE